MALELKVKNNTILIFKAIFQKLTESSELKRENNFFMTYFDNLDF